MKASKFVFDYVDLLHYKCYEMNLNVINSPDWIKNKKAAINPVNKKDKKCFLYSVIIALNHD